VLLDVLIHGSRSRAELGRRTGLSRASLMRLTRDLVEFGFVTEGGAAESSGRGRPSDLVHVRPEAAHFAGIKLTGDTLYGAVTDLHANVVATAERSLDSREVDDVVALIAEVVAGFRAEYPRLAAVGVCLAGDVHIVEGKSVVVGSDFLGWSKVPIQSLVESATGLPASIWNDVQALTLGHHWFGAGVGCSSLVLIGLGAGIGSGIVVEGELIRGGHGRPGKVGHISVTSDGPVCDRGHVGCASAFVTIPAILRNAGSEGFWETLELAKSGDPVATAAFHAAGRALGAVVAELNNIIDPEKIIVTGEGLAMAEFAREQVLAEIDTRRDPAAQPVTLDLHAFNFSDYAWAAAISAIKHVV
jgi:predicted NBD/HSP70 family sugar kinase